MNRMLALLMLLGSTVLFGFQTAATAKPTLEETVAFLKAKIEETNLVSNYSVVLRLGTFGLIKIDHAYQMVTSDFSASGCEVAFRETKREQYQKKSTGIGQQPELENVTVRTKWEVTIPLGKIAMSRLEVVETDPHAKVRQKTDPGDYIKSEGTGFAQLTIPMMTGTKLRMVRTINDGDPKLLMSESEVLPVATTELANRLLKAFAHAASLCGSKDDPF